MNTEIERIILQIYLMGLVGSTLDILTDYSSITGVLIEVKFDYIILRQSNNFFYIPLAQIKSVAK